MLNLNPEQACSTYFMYLQSDKELFLPVKNKGNGFSQSVWDTN